MPFVSLILCKLAVSAWACVSCARWMSAGWRARNSRTGFCRAELENSERDSALRFSERLGLVDEFGRCGGNWRGARRQSETVENLLCGVPGMNGGSNPHAAVTM